MSIRGRPSYIRRSLAGQSVWPRQSSVKCVPLWGLRPPASDLRRVESRHERLQRPDDAAVTDLESLAVRCVCESEPHRKVDQVANLGRGGDGNADEVQVVAF